MRAFTTMLELGGAVTVTVAAFLVAAPAGLVVLGGMLWAARWWMESGGAR